MEVLRVPPYPIVTSWDVPAANTEYTVYVEDIIEHSYETEVLMSDGESKIQYELPRERVQFDREFLFRIYNGADITGDIVVDSNLTVYRPYVDPNMLGTTPLEVEEYKRWEIIARSIIDSYLGNDSATGEGFYNHKLIVQGRGDGTDYFPIWHNPKRILKVYENNVLVYDLDTEADWPTKYVITPNNSAIMRLEVGAYNRMEQKGPAIRYATGDIGPFGGGSVAFGNGYDYIFVLDVGYKTVPPDVEIATTMLIEDLKCGNNDYYRRFVLQYKTDQFDIKFAPQFLTGTGNLIVDKILDGYKGNVFKPGII